MTENKSESVFDVDAWFTPRRFSILLAIMVVATFPDVIFGQRTFVYRDFGLFFYPVAHYFRESFWHGEMPLWNPHNFCGLPFLAQWNTMTLYPPSLFFLLLPLSWSLGVFALLHLFLAGLGMYWLAWRWTNSRLSAAVAGVAFAYSGLMLACLMGLANLATLAWMPWVIFTFEKARREGGRQIIYAALVGALQMLTGTPEYILFTWFIVAALTLVEFRSRSKTVELVSLKACFRRGLSIVLLVSGLAAVQLLPFLDLLRHSHRHGETSTSSWSMPLWGWANFLVPLFRCYKSPAGVYIQSDQGVFSSYYLGIEIFALAFLALWKVREARVRLLGVIALFGAVLALGDNGFLYHWLRQTIPIFGFTRYPIRWVVVVAFAMPLLAAFGLRQLIAPNQNKRTWRPVIILSCLFLLSIFSIVLFSHWHPWKQEQLSTTLISGLTRAIFLVLTLGILYVLSQSTRDKLRISLGLGLVAVIWLDLITHTPSQNPTVESSIYAAPLPRLQQLRPLPKLGESRAMLTTKAITAFKGNLLSDPFNTFLVQRLGLFDNCNLLERIPKLDGFFSLQLEAEQNLFASIKSIQPRFADFLGISQISSDTNILEWQSRSSFSPWVTAGQQPIFADAATTLTALSSPQFDPRQTVYLPRAAQSFISATQTTSAKILSSHFSDQEFSLETEAATPAMLVVAQTYYHHWKPYIDGRLTTLWRANHAFQAIEIPAGRHQVRFAYEDRNFYWGAIISITTLLGCVATLLFWRKQN